MHNDKEQYLKELTEIRSMMESSSKFLAVSGMSGIFAGMAAMVGAGLAFWKFNFKLYPYYEQVYTADGLLRWDYMMFLANIAVAVLAVAMFFVVYFSTKKARKQGHKMWSAVSKRLAINLAVPLMAGGIFCFALLFHDQGHLIGATTLIFYGLALFNGSKYTMEDIRYLGICSMLLGGLALFITGYTLLFWAVGFGLLHIIFGYAMYRKYDL